MKIPKGNELIVLIRVDESIRLKWVVIVIIWASTRENLSSGFANSKGADQPAHPRRLISAFVIRFLESIIYKLNTGEISIF